MANGFEKIINESFSKYLTKNGVSNGSLNGIYGTNNKTSKKLNEWLPSNAYKGPGLYNIYYYTAYNDGSYGEDELYGDEAFPIEDENDLEYIIDDIENGNGNYSYCEKVGELEESCKSKKGKKLDEAVPRDLMDKIKNTRSYRRNSRSDDPLDYQSANMQEITAQDVMRMKKNGEDLSDIRVLNDDGDIIELDRYGHPIDSGSTGYPRANQSLKKTLDNATKIYKGKIDYFSQTQPDKYAERNSDSEKKFANNLLGKDRDNYYSPKRSRKDFHNVLEEPGQKIKALRKAYDDGDISRKEMETGIAKAKEGRERIYRWGAGEYNWLSQRKADARYYDSNKAARKNRDAYIDAKISLDWAKDTLKDSEEKLAKTKAGNGYGNKRVEELKEKIASLKYDLAYYEKQLAEDPVQKDLDDLQNSINSATQEIKDNQAIIDKLLRRK